MSEEFNTKLTKEQKQLIYKDLEDIQAVFDRFKVDLIIGYGALLGHYRDKNFLPGDDDIDICVIDNINLETRKKIGWALYDIGFMPQQIYFNVFDRMELSEPGYNGDGKTGIIVCERGFKFTIFFFKEVVCSTHTREYVCIPKLGSKTLISTPVKFYYKLDKIKIGKNKYLCPSPVEEYLSFTYFNNWKDKSDRRHGLLYPEMHNEAT